MRDRGKGCEADGQRGRWRGRADLCVKHINCRMWGNDERRARAREMDGERRRRTFTEERAERQSKEETKEEEKVLEREQASVSGASRAGSEALMTGREGAGGGQICE